MEATEEKASLSPCDLRAGKQDEARKAVWTPASCAGCAALKRAHVPVFGGRHLDREEWRAVSGRTRLGVFTLAPPRAVPSVSAAPLRGGTQGCPSAPTRPSPLSWASTVRGLRGRLAAAACVFPHRSRASSHTGSLSAVLSDGPAHKVCSWQDSRSGGYVRSGRKVHPRSL